MSSPVGPVIKEALVQLHVSVDIDEQPEVVYGDGTGHVRRLGNVGQDVKA